MPCGSIEAIIRGVSDRFTRLSYFGVKYVRKYCVPSLELCSERPLNFRTYTTMAQIIEHIPRMPNMDLVLKWFTYFCSGGGAQTEVQIFAGNQQKSIMGEWKVGGSRGNIFQNAIQEASNHIHIDSVCSAEGLWSKGTPTLSWRGYTIEIGHFFDEKLVKSNFWPHRWSCGIWTSVIQFVRTHNTCLLSLVWGHNSSGTCRGELFSKYRYFHTSLFRYRRTH